VILRYDKDIPNKQVVQNYTKYHWCIIRLNYFFEYQVAGYSQNQETSTMLSILDKGNLRHMKYIVPALHPKH